MKLFLNDKLGDISYEINATNEPKAILIIAHGAGAGMHHTFMETLASKFALNSITAVRFNFPYMEQGKKSPRSPKEAIKAWLGITQHIESQFPDKPVFISGKSYGGRMGSHLLVEETVNQLMKGIIYFGFPLHAPGRDSKDRADHLAGIFQPQLFIQGSKDKLANTQLIQEVANELPKATLQVIEQADHSFTVPKSLGISKEQVMDQIVNISLQWIKSVS